MNPDLLRIALSAAALLLWYILSVVNATGKHRHLLLEAILMGLGTILFLGMLTISAHVQWVDSDTVIGYQELHTPVQTGHLLSIALPVGLCVLSILLTGIRPIERRLHPVLYLLILGTILAGDAVLLLCTVQLNAQFSLRMSFYEAITLVIPFYRFAVLLYPINLLLLSIRRIRAGAAALRRQQAAGSLNPLLTKGLRTGIGTAVCILAAAILAALGIELVLVLCGQGLDGVIRALRDTSDWTFSRCPSRRLEPGT